MKLTLLIIILVELESDFEINLVLYVVDNVKIIFCWHVKNNTYLTTFLHLFQQHFKFLLYLLNLTV